MSESQSKEDAWIEEQRKRVEEYLQRERVDHLGVGEYPAFCDYPHLAVWAVQSKKAPGWVGWWAVSGDDLPADYVSRGKVAHPRQALRDLASQWREVAGYMSRGEAHPDISVGTASDWPRLDPLLRARAEILQSYVDDEEMWEGDLAEPGAAPNVGPAGCSASSDGGKGPPSVS